VGAGTAAELSSASEKTRVLFMAGMTTAQNTLSDLRICTTGGLLQNPRRKPVGPPA
jgi:hypothetical protein